MEYLIKWKNIRPEEDTWENEKFMKKHPQLQDLRKQFFSKRGDILRPQHSFILFYQLWLGQLSGRLHHANLSPIYNKGDSFL
jgi:hypothetical protein